MRGEQLAGLVLGEVEEGHLAAFARDVMHKHLLGQFGEALPRLSAEFEARLAVITGACDFPEIEVLDAD